MKTIYGILAVGGAVGFLIESNKKVQKLSSNDMSGLKLNPHRAVDMAMGFMNMNPVAKAIISEGFKKVMPEQHDGETITVKAKRIK